MKAKMRRSLVHITFFGGEKESQGIGDTSFLLGLMLSSEVHKQRGERTALQADRLHAAGGEIRDIMDVTEIRISQNKKIALMLLFLRRASIAEPIAPGQTYDASNRQKG